ncbi:MAG: S-layer homology domain-containing protein [Patescibacteria group bacterium]
MDFFTEEVLNLAIYCDNSSVNLFPNFRKVVLATVVFGWVFGVAQAASFFDVPVSSPNAAAIDYLSKEGVIAGYGDGSFRPGNPVNRAEALKILLLASGVQIQNPVSAVFPDVPADAWFAPFVFSAKNSGIVDGYRDGSFRPEQTVNLVEALKILLNTNTIPLENYTTASQLFADSEKDAWYNSFLLYAKTFNLVEPNSANQIQPATPLTRGALAEIVYRFQTRVETVCPSFLENAATLPTDYFQKITLTQNPPNTFYENEVFTFSGISTENGELTAVLENSSDKTRRQFPADVSANSFAVPVFFHTPGRYNFSLIPATTNSNTAATLDVLPRECAPATLARSELAPTALQTAVQDNRPKLTWADASNNIFRVVIRQGQNRVERLISAGQTAVALDPADFVDFTSGVATVQVFGAKSEHGFSYEPRTNWASGPPLDLNLGNHYFATLNKDKITITNPPTFYTDSINFSATAGTELENSIFLILPDGSVSESSILGSAATIAAGESFAVSLSLSTVGTYFLEINSTDGIAVLNQPLYSPGVFPLLPDFADLREAPNPNSKISINREKTILLRLINEFRLSQNLPAVTLDPEISAFAQNYADAMATQNFFGHTDPAGRSPDARRILAGLQMPVGENLARDATTENANAGLLRSAAHRQNLLDPEWTRVGLGIAQTENSLIFVEEFSADPLTPANLVAARNQVLAEINLRRSQNNSAAFMLDTALTPVAQGWSDKMIAENFIDFKNGSDSLENNVRAVDQTSAFMSFLVSASQLSQIATSLSDSILTDTGKSQIAIGLSMDSTGELRVTLIFR